jgi:DNA-directed RNA polymerase alpha subunit
LQARGPGIIRASDLKLPPSIICVDPNQYVATLTTDGVLNLRFTICEGFTSMQKSIDAFSSINKELITEDFLWFTNKKDQHLNLDAEDSMKTSVLQNEKKFKKSKILWLDPIFTPILKVNYIIESFGSLELNGENQVVLLELWTNGSLHPRDALYEALSELNNIFSKLEKMKILNRIFAKTFLNSNQFYSKMLKKVKFNYDYYKANSSNPNQNALLSPINILESSVLKDHNSNPEVLSSTDSQILSSSFKDLGIEYLGLPFRIKNCLINANLLTIDNLLNCRIEDLKKISGLGNQSFFILLKKLNEKGLKLKN